MFARADVDTLPAGWSGDVQLIKVPDEAMPADFLTKWVPKSKLRTSIPYEPEEHVIAKLCKYGEEQAKCFIGTPGGNRKPNSIPGRQAICRYGL